MTLIITPHLNFRGQARAALTFYRQVFDGELMLVSYADAHQAELAAAPDDIIWGQVTTREGLRIMAYDVQAARPHDAGQNAFYLSLRGQSAEEVEGRWAALADGATILQPLGPSVWSSLYGMLVDRFGITWIVDLEPTAA